jgi:hypothetical protein
VSSKGHLLNFIWPTLYGLSWELILSACDDGVLICAAVNLVVPIITQVSMLWWFISWSIGDSVIMVIQLLHLLETSWSLMI